jgi:hypothetical protein
MITGFAIGVASSFFMLLIAFAVAQNLKRGGAKELQLARMTERLQEGVAELIARADELDQDLKYMGSAARPELSERVAKACGDLVLVQDAVKVVQGRIASRNYKSAREDLLSALGIANKISCEINDLRERIRPKRLSG